MGEKDLGPQDFINGGQRFTERVLHVKPKVLAILGIGAYRKAFNQPKAIMGKQTKQIGTTVIWVLPNPSGLNAHYQLPELAQIYGEVRLAIE